MKSQPTWAIAVSFFQNRNGPSAPTQEKGKHNFNFQRAPSGLFHFSTFPPIHLTNEFFASQFLEFIDL